MKKHDDFSFKSEKLRTYMDKVRHESAILIDELIKEHSPIQKGDDVEVIDWGVPTMCRITDVRLAAKSSFGCPKSDLSFCYYGIFLSKKGVPMKNRKEIYISAFIKNGEEYIMPSYNRLEVIPAVMYHKYL